MNRRFNPSTIHPAGTYALGVESAPGQRWLHSAGQVGVAQDGSTPADFAGQAKQAFANLVEVIKGAGMAVEDIVKLTVYLTDAKDIPALREARSAMLGDTKVASTLLVVAALAAPELKIEVECVAAKG